MDSGQQSQEIMHPAAWRFGPNPRLANFALFATIGEMLLLFLRKPLDPTADEFLIGAIACGAFFFWLTIAWAVWFLYRGIDGLHLGSVHRKIIGVVSAGTAIVVACLYCASWGAFLYSGTFPDAEMFRFLATGSASELDFILSIIEQTLPNAGLFALGACGITAVVVPFGLNRLNSGHWIPRRLHGEGAAKLLTWIVPGLACIFFTGMTQSDADLQLRKSAIIRLKTQANPAVSLVASLVERSTSEPISKEIDMRLLRPLTPVPSPAVADLARDTKRPNVFFIAIESLRADMIDKQHQGKLIMPNMSDLARKSLVFTNAHSQSTHTDYCITSFLSSLYPMRSLRHHHPVQNAGYPKTQIYDWLKRYGYATGIITSDNTAWCDMVNFMISPGLDVFFDSRNLPATYSAQLRGYAAAKPEKSAKNGDTLDDKRTVNYAKAWLDDQFASGKPAFLHLMFQQTHFSYPTFDDSINPFQPAKLNFPVTFDAYPPDKVDIVRNAYFNAAHNVDIQLGRLLDYLESNEELDNSIIVLIGDHGEGFFEHNLVSHSRLPYEEFSRIPMIVYLPSELAKMHDAPRLVDYPTEQIDMAPTICGLLGIPIAPAFQGIDVLADDLPSLDERFTFTHVEVPGQTSGECVIQGGRWKFMQDRLSGLDYLFDLQADPAEKSNVSSSNPQVTVRLRNKLQLWRNSHLTYYKYNMYFEHYYQPSLPLTLSSQ